MAPGSTIAKTVDRLHVEGTRAMTVIRIGRILLVIGLLAIAAGLGFGAGPLGVGGIAVSAIAVAAMSLLGPWPLSGRLARAAVGIAGLGLTGFTLAAVAIDDGHPAAVPVDLALILILIASLVATATGSLLMLAASLRTIRGVRPSVIEGGQPGTARVRRVRRGLAGLLASLIVLGLAAYTTYVGAIGSDTLAHPVALADCRTPLVRYGWSYEAINYDIADDRTIQAANPDMTRCSSQGTKAGTEVVTADGVSIAGWYVPAANGVGPTGPTVVLVHGWDSNKSEVLKYAVPLHPTFNVVAIDERDGGRSGQAISTFGLHEKLDVEAIVDWLERTKHPDHIAVMGNSMGGGAAVLAAAGDPRIEALVLDSTHAHVSNILERRLEVDAGHPAMPGTPALIAGFWLRSGVDLMQADPINAIPALGKRPLLLIHGGADVHDLPALSVDLMDQKAAASGVPVEMEICPAGTHGQVIDACPTLWGQWIVGFLDRSFNLPS
jgi:pimeloyl-ACP methyl ester carboxylesterase